MTLWADGLLRMTGRADVSQGWKLTVIVAAAAGIVSTPLLWLLDSPDTGQLVGATVQAATGIAALVWALLQRPPAQSRFRDRWT